MTKQYNRHATVAQLREVLAQFDDTDCVHTNAVGNLTIIREVESATGDSVGDHLGYIELTSGDDDEEPRATYHEFGTFTKTMFAFGDPLEAMIKKAHGE